MFEFRRPVSLETNADEALTPEEVAQSPALWKEIFGRELERGTTIKRFQKWTIDPAVTLFSAHTGADTLIVAFAGKGMRLQMPTALFLQHLDDGRYDLLLLNDTRKAHYEYGAGEFALSLYDVGLQLLGIRQAAGYRKLMTYGTSMGGLAALRVGNLIGADRSISIAGLFAWDINRIMRNSAPVAAFDLLCECRSESFVNAYCLFGDALFKDARDAGRLCKILPSCTTIPMPANKHNFVYEIYGKGRLDEFHREIFDLDREPDPAYLRTLLL